MAWFLPFVVGVVVGTLGRLIMPGMNPAGFVISVIIGVVGAYFGALIGLWAGWYPDPGDSVGLSAALVGAIVVICASRLLLWPPHRGS